MLTQKREDSRDWGGGVVPGAFTCSNWFVCEKFRREAHFYPALTFGLRVSTSSELPVWQVGKGMGLPSPFQVF